jgi:hypothetical protein
VVVVVVGGTVVAGGTVVVVVVVVGGTVVVVVVVVVVGGRVVVVGATVVVVVVVVVGGTVVVVVGGRVVVVGATVVVVVVVVGGRVVVVVVVVVGATVVVVVVVVEGRVVVVVVVVVVGATVVVVVVGGGSDEVVVVEKEAGEDTGGRPVVSSGNSLAGGTDPGEDPSVEASGMRIVVSVCSVGVEGPAVPREPSADSASGGATSVVSRRASTVEGGGVADGKSAVAATNPTPPTTAAMRTRRAHLLSHMSSNLSKKTAAPADVAHFTRAGPLSSIQPTDNGAARAGVGMGVEHVALADEDGCGQRRAMGGERNLLQLARLGVKAATQPVYLHPLQVELAPCLHAGCVAFPATREIVIVTPGGEQRADGILEHRVQHEMRR